MKSVTCFPHFEGSLPLITFSVARTYCLPLSKVIISIEVLESEKTTSVLSTSGRFTLRCSAVKARRLDVSRASISPTAVKKGAAQRSAFSRNQIIHLYYAIIFRSSIFCRLPPKQHPRCYATPKRALRGRTPSKDLRTTILQGLWRVPSFAYRSR